MPVPWFRVLVVGIAAGLVFAIMDGLLNANPLAQRLYAVYRPIAREIVNAPLGLALDVGFGMVMAALFVMLAPALPGGAVGNAICFALIAWFFRVVMGVAGQAVMLKVPAAALGYTLAAGLLEMSILGCIYGWSLRPE